MEWNCRNNNIKVVNSIFSEDNFFVYGLCRLLSMDFINAFFTVLDFDCQHIDHVLMSVSDGKEKVAFVSNDIDFYKAEKIGIPHVLDKRSSVQDILGFFLLKRDSGIYHTKKKLTRREKELLTLMSDGVTHQEMTTKLGINYKTFYTHRRNLMLKLGCDNRIFLQNLFVQR
ncbi:MULTISPECIES: helix-turn-helix domain-containing protein [Winslowiella]|uniref:helix-turn-helix domain-containing protein n=1 Tax=Winslowiella TaxID=2997349 RepID=UPI0028BEF580|nr:helix-turn-helix transcriptional regulator [Winslowiella toletana]WNN44040.1 helix-turn-helix transcriptional regulator [Winslowiella toletana]